MSSGIPLFSKFIEWLYSTHAISIPSDYHSQCSAVRKMLRADSSGVISTLNEYAVDSASECKYSIECENDSLQKLLNIWLEKINLTVRGVPTGLQALAREYHQERFLSSFCVLRIKDWEKITYNNVTIEVPTKLWMPNGSSVWVDRKADGIYKLGSDKYFLDENKKYQIPRIAEDIVVQKAQGRWFDQYPDPYYVNKGVLKNYLSIQLLQEKGDEVIAKFLPYLFVITKGDKDLFLKDVNYTSDELQEMVDEFKTEAEKYRSEKGKTPVAGVPFDQKFEHLLPEIGKVLREELFAQSYRALLAGMGFVDLLEIAKSRQEQRLNPKPFIARVNSAVDGFKLLLKDTIAIIAERNKGHTKLFSENNRLNVVSSPLRVNTEQILDSLRSAYDRGTLSYKSYITTLGFDYETEKERRLKEFDEGDEELFYPRLITNQEQHEEIRPTLKKKKDNDNLEDEGKKPGTPEADNYKNAEIINEPIDPNLDAIKQEKLVIAPYKNLDEIPDSVKKYPKKAQQIWMKVWNEVYAETGDEAKAFQAAWGALRKWMKRHKKDK